jgi:hypothetical protein
MLLKKCDMCHSCQVINIELEVVEAHSQIHMHLSYIGCMLPTTA